MRNIVRQYIAKNFNIEKNDRIIVALSGGADSVCLAHLLYSLGYTCELAHCNFHLRGEESNRDERFVTLFAQQIHGNLHKIDFDTVAYARERKVSIEMAARDLRYAWFEQLRQELNAKYIAVAHHADDSVETVLMNFTRGTGIKGLCGIMPINGNIIRPLLCVNRKQILEYLENNHLEHVEDSTNKDSHFVRNRFRNVIIPELQKVNSAASQNIMQTIECMNEVNSIYQQFITDNMAKVVKNDGQFMVIDIEKVASSIAPKSLLFEILRPYGFNAVQCEEILVKCEVSGRQFFSGDYCVTTNRNELILSKNTSLDVYTITEETSEMTTPITIKFEYLVKNADFKLEKNARIGFFDINKLHFPLTLRHWQKGDFFHPIGMKGKKLLSDFFTDQKFSIPEKENVWILTSGDDIVWIVGLRPDNRYKITENTEKILKISL